MSIGKLYFIKFYDIVLEEEVIDLKKSIRVLIICGIVILGLVLIAGMFLYFNSPKYLIKNEKIERVYIYHNELERELYEFTDDEKVELTDAIRELNIGKSVSDDEYESLTGGPWFSFFCEMKNGKTVQLYAVGKYLHINSVPFEIDKESQSRFSSLHSSVEDKILPISPDLLEEIMNKRENS